MPQAVNTVAIHCDIVEIQWLQASVARKWGALPMKEDFRVGMPRSMPYNFFIIINNYILPFVTKWAAL